MLLVRRQLGQWFQLEGGEVVWVDYWQHGSRGSCGRPLLVLSLLPVHVVLLLFHLSELGIGHIRCPANGQHRVAQRGQGVIAAVQVHVSVEEKGFARELISTSIQCIVVGYLWNALTCSPL